MLSLAWPWVLLALPLPFIVRALLPEANQLQEAGLRVPSFVGFDVLADRSHSEQLLNWRIWVALIAWVLLVIAAARPERIGDELEPVEEPEAGFRPVQSLYFWPLSGAFALTALLCIVSLLEALRLRRISGAQTHAG